MPPTSLVKFDHKKTSHGKSLWWHRASHDGLPFRGPAPPLMPEEEYEARAVRVPDFRNAFFDVVNPEENALFQEVMDCCANGWFRLYFIERFWNKTTKHYVEWIEYYMEDGVRTPFVSSGMTELPNGHAHFLNSPG